MGAGLHVTRTISGPPSAVGPPVPAWNRPSAPRPTKLKAWVTIGYIPSSSKRISTIAPWAGDKIDGLRAPVALVALS